MTLALGLSAVASVRDLLGEPDPDHDARTHVRVAAGLASVGVRPGTRLAFVRSWPSAMRWGRLARVRLVAEVPWKDAPVFWQADPGVQAQVVAALCSTGAGPIVADEAPDDQATLGWSGVPGAPGYAYRRCAAMARSAGSPERPRDAGVPIVAGPDGPMDTSAPEPAQLDALGASDGLRPPKPWSGEGRRASWRPRAALPRPDHGLR